MKIKVWCKENSRSEVINHKRPRRYMCAWTFEQLLNYIKEELYWQDINEDSITTITIFNEREMWNQIVRK